MEHSQLLKIERNWCEKEKLEAAQPNNCVTTTSSSRDNRWCNSTCDRAHRLNEDRSIFHWCIISGVRKYNLDGTSRISSTRLHFLLLLEIPFKKILSSWKVHFDLFAVTISSKLNWFTMSKNGGMSNTYVSFIGVRFYEVVNDTSTSTLF